MPDKRIGFVHTTPTTIGLVNSCLGKYLPGCQPIHLYNAMVKIDNFSVSEGHTPKANLHRFADMMAEFERAECALAVCCCSLMPFATAFAGQASTIPFIQLDGVLFDMAVEKYTRIGVIKTTDRVVPFIKGEFERRARERGKEMELIFSENNTALALFNAGEYEKHDAAVLADMRDMASKDIDCLFMGQIPFALIEEKIRGETFPVPVLNAGEIAFRHLATLL